MSQMQQVEKAAQAIRAIAPDFKPRFGIALGSGLGNLTDGIENKISIAYQDIPGFPSINVKGQDGELVLGTIDGISVACLKGRAHVYDHMNYDGIKITIRTLQALGCEGLIATNASGSLRESVGPGQLVMINDHINFQGSNPLIGENDDDIGPRFPPMDDAYDAQYRHDFEHCAKALDITLHEGVYISVLGPSYETPAEIRAFKTLGADVIGMSTVPDVIIARHCGLKVAVIATITNFATGLTDVSHDHATVCEVADKASTKLVMLVKEFLKQYR